MSRAPRQLYATTIKLSQNHSMIATCYHEAGHAICALLMFAKVSNVFVQKDRLISGATDFDVIENVQDSELADFITKSEININYAGMVAEKIFYKDITGSTILPNVLKKGCEEDVRQVADIIKKNNLSPPGQKRYSYKKKIQSDTNKLLLEYWEDVKIVAHSLFDKKKLNYEDLKLVLTKKSSNKDFWKNQFKYISLYIDQEKEIDAKDIKIITRK